jgi:ATP-dependent RNA helicase RhlE
MSPWIPEDYVHRIGRTGRAGAAGAAVTFVTGADLGYLKSIEHRLGRRLDRESVSRFDYSGGEGVRPDRSEHRHSRSGKGLGSKSADALTEEELEQLLNPSN